MRLFFILFLTISPSLAIGQAAAGGDQPSFLVSIFPIIALFFIFYFLSIRPQMKKQKAHQALLSELKKGDEVLTSGGIFGTIEGLTEKFITLAIADGVRIRILRGNIIGLAKEVKND